MRGGGLGVCGVNGDIGFKIEMRDLWDLWDAKILC
jgi:hypothetical protein